MGKIVFLTIIFFSVGYCQGNYPPVVTCGADELLAHHKDLIVGKRIGLITNQSAVLADGRRLSDVLARDSDVKLIALFSPEHGIQGLKAEGASVQQMRDSAAGIPVYSLYGAVQKPTEEMLKGVDVLIFDVQDVGARFYTFLSTMLLAEEAAAEHGIPFLVLDRPNPIRGIIMEGPLRDDSLRSFVGWPPIPIAHGMTIGELAAMANGEGWLKNGLKSKLTVITMKRWKRTMWYDETGLQWIPPSPNMPTIQTAIVYPGTCLIEGTNVSEGRGSEKPFEYIGAPWVDEQQLAQMLNNDSLPGVSFQPITFVPSVRKEASRDLKYKGALCRGVFINVTARDFYHPVETGIALLCALQALFPAHFQMHNHQIDLLIGAPTVREMISRQVPFHLIVGSWSNELSHFGEKRRKYLLY